MRDIAEITGFHVHVYFSPETRDKAIELHNWFVQLNSFNITAGEIHEEPLGPHTQPMFALNVGVYHITYVLKFMILNRNGLSVLIHPLTNNEVEDHTTSAVWLGDKLPLDLERL